MAKTISSGMLSATVNGIKINTSFECSTGNYAECKSRSVSYIVMHYTGNSKDNALNNVKYFQKSGAEASAHFFVDDASIYQSVKLKDRAWHCGTSGKYYHSACRNANSIGIEMCCTAGNYKVSETTITNSAYLCACLCGLLGISASGVDEYVIRHYDVTHKKCPAQMVVSAEEWVKFKEKVKTILNNGSVTAPTASTPKTQATTATASKSVKAKDAAASLSASLAGTYKVTASALNVRHGAGTNKAVMCTIPKNTAVKCYGYYTAVLGTKWLYVQFTFNGVQYTGFCSSKYLSK